VLRIAETSSFAGELEPELWTINHNIILYRAKSDRGKQGVVPEASEGENQSSQSEAEKSGIFYSLYIIDINATSADIYKLTGKRRLPCMR